MGMVEETKEAVNTHNESVGLSIPKNTQEVHESMEVLGNTIEDFGKKLLGGTTVLLSQMKETVQQELQAASIKHKQTQQEMQKKKGSGSGSAAESKEDSERKRFETKVSAMQRDSGTYCDEPEDVEYFELWKAQFDLGKHKEQVEETLDGNAFMVELQNRIVPLIVDYHTFWTQYFFRLHLIKLEEGMEMKVLHLEDEASSPSSPESKEDDTTPEESLAGEPDAATASDSSANDWINVKAKSKGSPSQGSPKALAPTIEHTSEKKADAQAEEEKKLAEEVLTKNAADNGDEEEEELSPLPSPAPGSKFADAIDDDDIDEDWGEM